MADLPLLLAADWLRAAQESGYRVDVETGELGEARTWRGEPDPSRFPLLVVSRRDWERLAVYDWTTPTSPSPGRVWRRRHAVAVSVNHCDHGHADIFYARALVLPSGVCASFEPLPDGAWRVSAAGRSLSARDLVVLTRDAARMWPEAPGGR